MSEMFEISGEDLADLQHLMEYALPESVLEVTYEPGSGTLWFWVDSEDGSEVVNLSGVRTQTQWPTVVNVSGKDAAPIWAPYPGLPSEGLPRPNFFKRVTAEQENTQKIGDIRKAFLPPPSGKPYDFWQPLGSPPAEVFQPLDENSLRDAMESLGMVDEGNDVAGLADYRNISGSVEVPSEDVKAVLDEAYRRDPLFEDLLDYLVEKQLQEEADTRESEALAAMSEELKRIEQQREVGKAIFDEVRGAGQIDPMPDPYRKEDPLRCLKIVQGEKSVHYCALERGHAGSCAKDRYLWDELAEMEQIAQQKALERERDIKEAWTTGKVIPWDVKPSAEVSPQIADFNEAVKKAKRDYFYGFNIDRLSPVSKDDLTADQIQAKRARAKKAYLDFQKEEQARKDRWAAFSENIEKIARDRDIDAAEKAHEALLDSEVPYDDGWDYPHEVQDPGTLPDGYVFNNEDPTPDTDAAYRDRIQLDNVGHDSDVTFYIYKNLEEATAANPSLVEKPATKQDDIDFLRRMQAYYDFRPARKKVVLSGNKYWQARAGNHIIANYCWGSPDLFATKKDAEKAAAQLAVDLHMLGPDNITTGTLVVTVGPELEGWKYV